MRQIILISKAKFFVMQQKLNSTIHVIIFLTMCELSMTLNDLQAGTGSPTHVGDISVITFT